MKKIPKNTAILQSLQNNMIRVILGFKRGQHVNMVHVREKLNMMSVNQMSVYHTILEAYNIMKNSASEQIRMKWTDTSVTKYSLRSASRNDLKIPERPVPKCMGFSYNGPNLFNRLPQALIETTNPHTFKSLTKKWVWKNIPSQ